MRNLIIIIVLSLCLQGCIFVVGAAAGATAIAVVYDHRKIEKIVGDQQISNTIANDIKLNKELATHSHISVTCFNQTVLLTGEAMTPEYRAQAETLANNVVGVKRVYNEITIKGPTSNLTRASDSWITTKIKTQMLATKGLESGTIKVITENGTVYLMGVVNQTQAETSVEIARRVAGVQKVVKIFQNI